VGNIEIAFVEYSSSKKALIRPDIVEYNPSTDKPMYDLIIGKQTMQDLGVVLDFKESTIQIDKNPLAHERYRSSAAQNEHFKST
jgi:hypothetical protein